MSLDLTVSDKIKPGVTEQSSSRTSSTSLVVVSGTWPALSETKVRKSEQRENQGEEKQVDNYTMSYQ